MARRRRKELDEKLAELAEKLGTSVIEEGQERPGLYIHVDPMMRGYSIFRNLPRKVAPHENSHQILGRDPESITVLYKKIVLVLAFMCVRQNNLST